MILKDYLNRTSLLGRYFFIPLDMLSYHNSLFVDFYSTRTLKFFFEDISEENPIDFDYLIEGKEEYER